MSFNFIAPFYDRLAALVFGQTLKKAQIALLSTLPQNASVLIVGGGTGWIVEEVLHQCNPRWIVYLEASEQMLRLTKQRLQQHPQGALVSLRHGTETALVPNEQFDVILTPFVLDLFPPQRLRGQFIPSVFNVLANGGYWLITDFVSTPVWWHRGLAWAMYAFFGTIAGVRAHKLPDWPALMTQYPTLTCRRSQTWWRGFITSHLYQRTE